MNQTQASTLTAEARDSTANRNDLDGLRGLKHGLTLVSGSTEALGRKNCKEKKETKSVGI